MGHSKLFGILLVLICQTGVLFAQQSKYFIYFRDKNNSAFSISNPAQFLSIKSIDRRVKYNLPVNYTDLPVTVSYIQDVAATGAQILYPSKWLNGVLVNATSAQLAAIEALPFVASSKKSTLRMGTHEIEDLAGVSASQGVASLNYGTSFNQYSMIGIDKMHEEGFTGKNMLIAVIDGGFLNANVASHFDSLNQHNRIIYTYDIVDQETDVFDDHDHGTKVLSIMAAYEEGALIGGAWQADYILIRSEDAGSETLSEEYNWVRAAEIADSAGAYIINSSLGYNEFDDPTTNHTYAELNGDFAIITQAADLAASKGILVVNSAGNEGTSAWKFILPPADGDSVLAVGGVTPWETRSGHSSIGPAADGRIKPDVAAQSTGVVHGGVGAVTGGGTGTSFAAPLITSLAAGLWQKHPEMSNMDLLYLIKRSGHQYATPDNFLGYGIPHFSRASELMEANSGDVFFHPNPVSDPLTIVFPEPEIGGSALIYIYDVAGRQVAKETLPTIQFLNQLKINSAYWEKGVYVAKIITSQKEYRIKFCKL